MHRSTSALTLTLAAAALALASPGGAAAQPASPPPPKPPRFAIGTNPLAIPFGYFFLDLETATRTPGLTVGAAGTWITDGRDQRWADARVMYFPNEVAMRGFALGLTAGVMSKQGDPGGTFCYPGGGGCVSPRAGETAPTLGVRMDYDWLLGARKRMLVGLGVGAKRVLRDVQPGSPLEQVYADGRFVVGIVF